eukprot:GILK01001965.1.p2 GENE.GILK01001965.1~~GILK01001965.1.p2  ORF type:complete len:178 (+),score=3.45 GILK01001965.1:64-597(+)
MLLTLSLAEATMFALFELTVSTSVSGVTTTAPTIQTYTVTGARSSTTSCRHSAILALETLMAMTRTIYTFTMSGASRRTCTLAAVIPFEARNTVALAAIALTIVGTRVRTNREGTIEPSPAIMADTRTCLAMSVTAAAIRKGAILIRIACHVTWVLRLVRLVLAKLLRAGYRMDSLV